MNKVNGYNLYQNTYYDSTINKKTQSKTSKTTSSRTGNTQKTGSNVQLSNRAKALLQELKNTYSNMDFMVADYETEEEAASYLGRGTKEYSVLIDPETLEAMAADEDTKNQYLDQIEAARTDLNGMKEQLEETGEKVSRVGMVFDDNGNVSYFAEVEKISEKYKEHIDKGIEKRKEEKAEQAKKNDGMPQSPDRVKKTTVYADSVDELLKKIREVDWDKIQEEEVKTNGGFFDFSI